MTDRNVHIEHFDLATLETLAQADLAAANASGTVAMPDDFVAKDWVGLWRMRRDQVRDDPGAAAWVTGAIVDQADGAVVGRAGFHGPPDAEGVVEVGYTVLEPLRRRGYGRAVLAEMLRRAAEDPDVRVVRASISPGNVASRTLVESFGFVEVGDQWDDEDGLELVYDRPAR